MCEMCEPNESAESNSSVQYGDQTSSSTPPLDLLLDVKTTNNGDEATNSPTYVNFSLLPCKVCGVSSSGYHYGIISCEGCKGFFARSMRRARANGVAGCTAKPYQHRCSGVPESNNCKQCRYEKCLLAGMSLLAVQIGRHSLQRREQTRMEVSRLAQHNQLLSGKIFRRRLFNRIGGVHPDGFNNPTGNSSPGSNEQESDQQSVSFRKPSLISSTSGEVNLVNAPSSSSKSESNIPVDLTNFCGDTKDYSRLMGQMLQNLPGGNNAPNFGIIPPALQTNNAALPQQASNSFFSDPRNLLLLANSGNPFLMAQLALAAASNNNLTGQISNNCVTTASKQQPPTELKSVLDNRNGQSVNTSACQPESVVATNVQTEASNEDNNANLAAMFTQFTDIELAFLCAMICFNFNTVRGNSNSDASRGTSPINNNNSIEQMAIDSPLSNNADAVYWSAVELFMKKLFPNSAGENARFETFRRLVGYFRKTARCSGWTVSEFVDRFSLLLTSGRSLLKNQQQPPQ